MADDDLASLAEAATAEAASASRASTDIAARIRTWFVEAYTSAFWTDYRAKAKEDLGYYTGEEGQWSYEGSTAALEKLREADRAHVSINHIQAIVDVLTGFERQNRYDLKTMPEGEEDADQAELMTWLLKHVQEQTDTHAFCSEVFENAVIQGLAALEVGIDWTGDTLNGEIVLEVLTPGEDVLWDPNWARLDLSDARFVLRFRMAWVEDLVAEYPEHERAIREAVGSLEVAREGGTLSEWSPSDAYGSVRQHPQETDAVRALFYDAAGGGRLMLAQAWYADYEDAWIVSDKRTGTVTEADTGAVAREMAESDPEHLTAIRRRKRLIRSALVIPGLYQVLEEDETPYENDQQAYPILVCVGKRKGDKAYGIVRNLKDPQLVENKRESQLIDLVANIAALRIVYFANSLDNPAALKDPFSREPIAIRPGHEPPAYLVPPIGEIVSVLRAIGDRNKMAIREISGINTELLGLETDQASGIAIARRQAQGQIISTVWFDNYRYFRRLLGKRLARRIQQVYSMERTLRLTGPRGEQMMLKLNPAEARDMAPDEFARYREEQGKLADGRPQILRDVSALKYDVVISEVPTTPSQRATSLLAILEILKVFPGIAQALIRPALELAEIPDRTRVLADVDALLGAGPAGPPKPPGGQGPPPGMPTPTSTGAAGLPMPERGPAAV